MTSMPTDKIKLNAIRFYGYHGVSDEEQATGRQYEVDIELPLDLRAAGRSDRIRDTINYRELFEIVLKRGNAQRFRLLEALAHRIADDILRQIDVPEVLVRVRKLAPPLPSFVDSAEVEIVRTRADFPI